MRIFLKAAAVAVTTAALLTVSFSPANAIDNQIVSGNVTAGGLSAAVSGASLSSVALGSATSQVASGSANSTWTITDARGSGAAWSLTASGTDFTSAAGSVDTTPRTLPIGNLVINPGTVTAAGGADNAPSTSPVTMTNSAQPLVGASAGGYKGTFTLTPSFALTVPANAFRSNFATGNSGPLNPYISTLTFTIA